MVGAQLLFNAQTDPGTFGHDDRLDWSEGPLGEDRFDTADHGEDYTEPPDFFRCIAGRWSAASRAVRSDVDPNPPACLTPRNATLTVAPLFRIAGTIFLLVAAVVQATPLRSCALSRAVSGSSCHEGEVALAPVAAEHADGARVWDDGHAGSGEAHDPSCACERPKGQLNRDVSAGTPATPAPDSVPTLDFILPAGGVTFISPAEPSPDGIQVARNLPLLI
jgi:hypothetical protein